MPVDHLYGSTLFLPWLEHNIAKNDLCVATPDTGGTKRASTYAKHLGVDMAICYKQRKVANQVENMTVIGDVKGKNVVIVDDMCDTAGTLTKAADLMMEHSALSVRAICTHPVLSGPPLTSASPTTLFKNSSCTDSIPLRARTWTPPKSPCFLCTTCLPKRFGV